MTQRTFTTGFEDVCDVCCEPHEVVTANEVHVVESDNKLLRLCERCLTNMLAAFYPDTAPLRPPPTTVPTSGVPRQDDGRRFAEIDKGLNNIQHGATLEAKTTKRSGHTTVEWVRVDPFEEREEEE